MNLKSPEDLPGLPVIELVTAVNLNLKWRRCAFLFPSVLQSMAKRCWVQRFCPGQTSSGKQPYRHKQTFQMSRFGVHGDQVITS